MMHQRVVLGEQEVVGVMLAVSEVQVILEVVIKTMAALLVILLKLYQVLIKFTMLEHF
jgi:hypothetical protein